MRVQTGLLGKSFEAEITLKGTFSRMSTHVDFQVRFTAKSCVANLVKQSKYV